MYRPCAVALMLGFASPAAAPGQMPGPIAWTLASGDYTVFGHTDYPPTLILLPRIIYDTARGVDSLRTVDSVRVAALTTTVATGLAAGLAGWPNDLYCGGVSSGAMQ